MFLYQPLVVRVVRSQSNWKFSVIATCMTVLFHCRKQYSDHQGMKCLNKADEMTETGSEELPVRQESNDTISQPVCRRPNNQLPNRENDYAEYTSLDLRTMQDNHVYDVVST